MKKIVYIRSIRRRYFFQSTAVFSCLRGILIFRTGRRSFPFLPRFVSENHIPFHTLIPDEQSAGGCAPAGLLRSGSFFELIPDFLHIFRSQRIKFHTDYVDDQTD